MLAADRTRTARSTREWREWLTFAAFIAPNLILLSIFAYWPLIQNFTLSFTEWDMISPDKRFVGLDNWIAILSSARFWNITLNTATFMVGSVGLTLVVGLALALLLNQPLRFRNGARTVIFTPTVLSGAAVAIVWYFIFDPNWGVLKTFLGVFGLPSPRWVVDIHWAMPAVIIVYVWKTAGYAAVIFLAGLQGIPRELYEAARVDGANAWDRFRAVTIPGLAPITFFLLVTSILLSFQAFDIINVMTGGGPVIATTTLLYEYYNQGFVGFHAGSAAVYAITLFVLMLVLTIAQLRYVERRVTYG
ncbi:MAG: sugar ABC transporter permease [Chloroflexi bacterium]|nr:sugar ABC transporter permease [Chloroflexota bacterium]